MVCLQRILFLDIESAELVDTDLSAFLRDNEERKQTLKEILYSLFSFKRFRISCFSICHG